VGAPVSVRLNLELVHVMPLFDVVLADQQATAHPRRGMAFTDAWFNGRAPLASCEETGKPTVSNRQVGTRRSETAAGQADSKHSVGLPAGFSAGHPPHQRVLAQRRACRRAGGPRC
jgi:hypothetical protein